MDDRDAEELGGCLGAAHRRARPHARPVHTILGILGIVCIAALILSAILLVFLRPLAAVLLLIALLVASWGCRAATRRARARLAETNGQRGDPPGGHDPDS